MGCRWVAPNLNDLLVIVSIFVMPLYRVHYILSRCYPVSSFHIDILLILLPTKLLHTSSGHRTPMDPSHTWGHMEISEALGIQRWWYSDLYSVWGMGSLFPQCKNIPKCRHFVTRLYMYAFNLTMLAEFSRAAERFSRSYISSTS